MIEFQERKRGGGFEDDFGAEPQLDPWCFFFMQLNMTT